MHPLRNAQAAWDDGLYAGIVGTIVRPLQLLVPMCVRVCAAQLESYLTACVGLVPRDVYGSV